mmetsp:Transcript_68891/g.195315  ORF Transcript_68891/g.195315 Transcript_68891/m.195315 type:complete len:82 (+) Transcript_68891:391-636(+)
MRWLREGLGGCSAAANATGTTYADQLHSDGNTCNHWLSVRFRSSVHQMMEAANTTVKQTQLLWVQVQYALAKAHVEHICKK